MSQSILGTYDTQFISQSDDDETMYNVEKILDEKGRKFLVQWEGIDPTTGEKWAPDWVAKSDCTDDLIADWKREKAKKKRLSGVASIKSSSSVNGSIDGRAPTMKSRSVSKKTSTTSTAGPSKVEVPKPAATKTHSKVPTQSGVYVGVSTQRAPKRRRESDAASEPLSPVKRLKLGGPASPLPASPFDNEDGGLGSIVKKKQRGIPTTYKRKKAAIVKSPSFPKLAGPFSVKSNVAKPSGRTASKKSPNVMDVSSDDDDDDAPDPYGEKDASDTDTESEEETIPPPKGRTAPSKGSPLKSQSEPALKPRTRNVTRTLGPDPTSFRSVSIPFVRPYPTSSARTRSPPLRDARVRREIERKIRQGMPEDEKAHNLWPRVVLRDVAGSRKSDGSRASTSRASIATGSRRTSKAASEMAQTEPARAPADLPIPPSSANAPTPSLTRKPSLVKPIAGSNAKPSPTKSVSFHVDGVDDYNEGQANHEPTLPATADEANGGDLDGERSISISGELPPPPNQDETPTLGRPESRSPPPPSLLPKPAPTRVKLRPSEVIAAGRKPIIKAPSGARPLSTRTSTSGNHGDLKSNSRVKAQTKLKSQSRASDSGSESSESAGTRDSDEGSARAGNEESEVEDSEGEPDPSEQMVQGQEGDTGEEKGEGQQVADEVDIPSSPSLGGGANVGNRSRSISPIQETPTRYQGQPTLAQEGTATVEEPDEPASPTNDNDTFNFDEADVSMAHVMEVDELLSSNVSQQSIEDDHRDEESAEHESSRIEGESTIELVDSTVDASQVGTQAHAETIENASQPAGRVLAPDTQPTAEPADHPQTTRTIMSALLPGILDSSQPPSQSKEMDTIDQDQSFVPPTLPLDVSSQPIQSQPPPASQPDSQPQERTHSSIEEPASSWEMPPPGQKPAPADTISTFTPTNPSVKEPLTAADSSAERILPSSLTAAINGHAGPSSESGQDAANLNQSSPRPSPDRAAFLSSSAPDQPGPLGPVPDMSVDVFRRQMSPGSDIGQFDSPHKPTFLRASAESSNIVSIPPYQRPKATQDPSPQSKWGESSKGSRSGSMGPERFDQSAIEERDKRIREQQSRIEELLADVARLEDANRASEAQTATFFDSATRLTTALNNDRVAHAREIEERSATIADLRKQVEVARSQFETAESQREFALGQYTIASTEAKRLSDENKTLDQKVQRLEAQLKSGLLQWQRGFESNVERHQQEVQKLQGQLEAEREMYKRAKAPELCRRAAEWYELKNRIKELEEECAEAERREEGLRERERDIRKRELELTEQESAPRLSQPQIEPGDRGLSQDDLQTETILSDRSAVLASLDGPIGEDLVWACSYREDSGKICGKAFDTMGMLLGHVLDSAGHNVEGTCSCAQIN